MTDGDLPRIDEYRIIGIPTISFVVVGRVYGIDGVPDGEWRMSSRIARIEGRMVETVHGAHYRMMTPWPPDDYMHPAAIDAVMIQCITGNTVFRSPAETVAALIEIVALAHPCCGATEDELRAFRRRTVRDE
ncbi:hypothetical protein JL101_027715 [Skermanella rosea]|uniref:Uncharacterized protein n=1 Tax=Skermanella cutis TaxID=2775420 RepID=A0ABX7B5E5_9PROT|nr:MULTISPECIES: hypothetical protein [Skermanella]QQP89546.1 hypothetical protein IGS68_26860 [Skermanella sp. TT6]UEM03691.1 hypothetical protein JL101_027715 [Skermanella rosea]